jgi:hypothetical protein
LNAHALVGPGSSLGLHVFEISERPHKFFQTKHLLDQAFPLTLQTIVFCFQFLDLGHGSRLRFFCRSHWNSHPGVGAINEPLPAFNHEQAKFYLLCGRQERAVFVVHPVLAQLWMDVGVVALANPKLIVDADVTSVWG